MTEFASLIEKLLFFHSKEKSSLQKLQQISAHLGSPETSFPAIHVAGSNGKGSVCFKVAKALEYAGYKTGLYTSPHIHSYVERIHVNSACIPESFVVTLAKHLLSLTESLQQKLTFFEYTTLLALAYFHEQNVDVAVIETGLGGRRDATRLVDPILSIITSISLEHTALLGNTLEEIAWEKVGICRKEVPLLVGPKAQLPLIERIAKEEGCPLIKVVQHEEFYDLENQQIAHLALKELQHRFTALKEEHIHKALKERPECRMEKIGPFLLDVAHNPDAFDKLFTYIAKTYPTLRIQAIIGMSSDKDAAACLSIAGRVCSHIFLVAAGHARTFAPEEMARICDQVNYIQYTVKESVDFAIKDALECSDEALTVICGSFYLMAEAKKAIASSLCSTC